MLETFEETLKTFTPGGILSTPVQLLQLQESTIPYTMIWNNQWRRGYLCKIDELDYI